MEDTSATYKTMLDEIRNLKPTAVPLIDDIRKRKYAPEIGESPKRLVTLDDFDIAETLNNAPPYMIDIYIRGRIIGAMKQYTHIRQFLNNHLNDNLIEELGGRIRHVLHDVLNREGIRMYHHDNPYQTKNDTLFASVMYQHKNGLRPVTLEYELPFEVVKNSFPDEMCVLSKEVNNIVLYHVFEPHTQTMRYNMIDEIRHLLLSQYKNRNIIAGYDVIVNDENNPRERVEAGYLCATIEIDMHNDETFSFDSEVRIPDKAPYADLAAGVNKGKLGDAIFERTDELAAFDRAMKDV